MKWPVMPLLEDKYDNIVLYSYDIVDFIFGFLPKTLMSMFSALFFLAQAFYGCLTREPNKRYDKKALNALALSKALILGAHVKTQDAQKQIIDPMLQEIIPIVTYLTRIIAAMTLVLGLIAMLTRLLPIPRRIGEYLLMNSAAWIYSIVYGNALEFILKYRKNLVHYLNIDTQLHKNRTSVFRTTLERKKPSLFEFTNSSKGIRSDSVASSPEGVDKLRSSSIHSTNPADFPSNHDINSLLNGASYIFYPPAAINSALEKPENTVSLS